MRLLGGGLVLSTIGILYSGYALADSAVVNVNGRLVSSPCTVDTAKSDLTVNLGTFDAPSLAAAGAAGTQKTFNLSLKDCPSSTTVVKAAFSGTAYKADAQAYANTGTATNLGLQVKLYTDPWASITTFPGGTAQANVNTTDHTATFNMTVRPYTKTGGVMPGTINTPVTVTFIYQ